MDMQIDALRIRAERERRAWSQEHLAEVTGLSLRTIQRVESSGAASFETARALAAVLGYEVSSLQRAEVASVTPLVPMPESPPRRVPRSGWRYLGAAASMLLALGVFLARDAHAGEVMLEVVLNRDAVELGRHQLVAEEGKSAEFRYEGEVRWFVSPNVTQDGSILLSMRVEEPAGTRWVQIGDPRVMVIDGHEVQVKVTSPKGSVFRISLRPRRL